MSIAKKVLGAGGLKSCRRERVTVTVGDGEEVVFEVRQPTLAERKRIFAPKVSEKGVEIQKDSAEIEVDAVIACAIDPETGGAAFGPEHREQLLAQPDGAGSWVSKLAATVVRLTRVEGGAGKGSAATVSESSSN
jgi:hypothetical protein